MNADDEYLLDGLPPPSGNSPDHWPPPPMPPAGRPANIGQDPKFPKSALTAGIIWLVCGGIIIVNSLASFATTAGLAAAEKNAVAAGGSIWQLLVGAVFGGVFLHVGYQTTRGTAADTLGNAIGSILFGIPILSCAGWMLVGSVASRQPVAMIVGAVVAGIFILAGVALIVAGVMAIIGRADYKLWRRYNRGRMGL